MIPKISSPLRQSASNDISWVFFGEVTRKGANVISGTVVLPVVHPTLNTLEAAVVALNFTELNV